MKIVFCITGVTGQDGSYAAEILLLAGIKVIGLTRDTSKKIDNLQNIYNNKNFEFIQTDYSHNSLDSIIKDYKITNIMNFCGQSYVSRSWEQIEETISSQAIIIIRLINIIKTCDWPIKLINSSSSEIYSESIDPRNELSNKSPCNPYGCAQQLAYNLIKSFRNTKQLWLASAILFPHESLRRKKDFLFQRLLSQVDEVLIGSSENIIIGNPFIIRDWGFAVEYVYYMLLIMFLDSPIDINLCTGVGYTVAEFASSICNEYNLNINNLLLTDPSLSRQYEPQSVIGDNTKLISTLKIKKPKRMKLMVKELISIRKNLANSKTIIDQVTDYLSDEQINFITNNKNLFLNEVL
tara:strand:+ start:31506 stop:32558 length:1053 start_codon:yes stop_codon:yes gene_type:complete